jgi:hypothetical protein
VHCKTARTCLLTRLTSSPTNAVRTIDCGFKKEQGANLKRNLRPESASSMLALL